jgi:ATP-binding cassette subfamily B protein
MKNNAEIAEAERKSGIRTILRIVPYLWPKDRFDFRIRVISALVLLVLAKVVKILHHFYTEKL